MRSYVYLLGLSAVLASSADLSAHTDRGSVVEGVRWHGHEHHQRGNRVLHEAFGSRKIWGVHSRHLDLYENNREQLSANGYDDVLVTYRVRDERRRRRDDRRRRTIAVGIAHLFSKYRMREVVIERFDQSRSRVIDPAAIQGVLLTHARGYGNVTFDESAIVHLSQEWQERYPTDRGQHYRFYGRVAAVFSDGNRLLEVVALRRGRGGKEQLDHRPVVLLHGDYLERQRRDRRELSSNDLSE